MLATTAVVTELTWRRPQPSLAHSLDALPSEIHGWRLMHRQVLEPDDLAMLRPTAYVLRTYEKGGQQLGLFIAYYESQHATESMHSPLHCLPGNGWAISRRGTLSFSGRGKELFINDDSIHRVDESDIMLYWYQSRRHVVANEFLGKLMTLGDAILKGETEGSLVRIVLPESPQSEREGIGFAKELFESLQWCFGEES